MARQAGARAAEEEARLAQAARQIQYKRRCGVTAFVDGVTAYTVTRSEEYDGWIVVVVNSEEQGYRL